MQKKTQLKQTFTRLVTNLSINDRKIHNLENVANLENRLDGCETYSSEHCLIMENSPITNDITDIVP